MNLTKTKLTPKRESHQLDAQGKVFGRLASETARLLMGKHKTDFVPFWDQGDLVEIANIKKLKFTGKKLNNKIYYHHSQYPGGIKSATLKQKFSSNPEEIFRKTVYQMLPKNKLRAQMIKRLKFTSN